MLKTILCLPIDCDLTASSKVEVNLSVEHAKWGSEGGSVTAHIHGGQACDFKAHDTSSRT